MAPGAAQTQDYAATDSLGVQANKSTPNTFLTEQCQKAVEMLSKMTTPSGQGGAKTYDLIPRASVRACLGIQFFDLKLVGAGISLTRGLGFTIRKLGKLNGVTQWSAPCFLRVNNIGLGATLGYDDLQTVVILGTEEVLDKHKGGRNLFGIDFDMIVGRDSAVVQSDVSESQAIPYSLAGGALLDFSIKGGRVQVDKGLNGRLYGSAVLPEHILHGDVAPPKEMFPLFEALNRLAADS